MKIFVAACLLMLASAELIAQTSNTDSLVIDVSNALLNQDNPSVSINRKSNNVIVIGAASDYNDMDTNGISAFTSTDTGRTWNLFRLPLPTDQLFNYGEASLTSDNAGNFYYAYITKDGNDVTGLLDSAGSINIATSADGKLWKNASPINNNPEPLYGSPDGITITADNSSASPHNGRIYAVWNQSYSVDTLLLKEGVYIAWSDNHCQSWTTPKLLSDGSDDYQTVRTGKNGEIFVVFSDSANFGHQVFSSTDGGQTFSSNTINGFSHYPFFTTGIYNGETGLKGSQGIPANPYAAFDVNTNSNRIHCVFGDYHGNVASQSYSFSDDDGKNWSAPQIIGINLLDSADRFDPSVSVDPKTGDAYVLYYSSESDRFNILTAPYRLKLTDVLADQGQILSPEFNPLVVEKTSTDPAYIGDHTASDAIGGVYVGAWTQNRSGNIDADIFAFVSLTSQKNSVAMPVVVRSDNPWLSAPYPNPVTAKKLSFSYYLPYFSHISFDLFDEAGRQIKHLADKTSDEGTYTEEFDLGNTIPGTYIVRMVTVNSQLSRKFILTAR
ncbi:MAG: T9SS type A sorting domain-containing protein [Candidatus Kapaibacterium sp.]